MYGLREVSCPDLPLRSVYTYDERTNVAWIALGVSSSNATGRGSTTQCVLLGWHSTLLPHAYPRSLS